MALSTTSRSRKAQRREQADAQRLASLATTRWLGMRIATPGDWEIVKHSVNAERGRLAFVDRRRQRLQVCWAQMPASPDVGQQMDDYKARDLEVDPSARHAALVEVGGWRGYRGTVDGLAISRASRYDARTKRWVELTMPWPDGVDEVLERGMLEGFAIDPPGDVQCMRAFRTEIHLASAWEVSAVVAKPANVAFEFSCGRRELTVRRLGMADAWFDGNLDNLLYKRVNVEIDHTQITTYRGHPAAVATSTEKATRASRLLGMARRRTDRAWFCEASNVVYCTTELSPKRKPLGGDACIVPDESDANTSLELSRLAREVT